MAKRRPRRLHVCTDETGQDTQGEFFLVATVIVEGDRDNLVSWLEECEQVKRRSSKADRETHYLQAVIMSERLAGSMFYSVHQGTTDFRGRTMESIRLALENIAPRKDYEADIVVDGLNPSDIRLFAKDFRSHRIPVRKVRGARDQSDAMTRLAHNLAKFARQGTRGTDREICDLLDKLRSRGSIRRV